MVRATRLRRPALAPGSRRVRGMDLASVRGGRAARRIPRWGRLAVALAIVVCITRHVPSLS